MSIHDAVVGLAGEIVKTQEFLSLRGAKQIITQNRKFNAMLQELQSMQERANNQNISGRQAELLHSEIESVYQKLLLIPEFNNLFNASNSFDMMCGEITQGLYKKLLEMLG